MKGYAAIPWSLVRTVEPDIRVVGLDELKHHLHVTWDEENDRIEDLALSAEQTVEDELSKALTTQTWVLRLDRFPCYEMRLPRPTVGKGPFLASLTSVQYLDGDGATQILGGSVYTVDSTSRPARIHLAYNQVWPVTRDIPNAVIVTYVAGKTTGEAVPENVRDAIKLIAGELYMNRERSAVEVLRQLDCYNRLIVQHQLVHEFRYE